MVCLPVSLRMSHFSAGTPVILGIPFDANSSYMRGAAGAPAAIRMALHSGSGNSWTESGVDLGVEGVFQDAGDLGFTADAFTTIEGRVGELMDRGLRPISLGGDHSITLPVVRAIAKRIPELTIVHFDAHPDLYDQLEGIGCHTPARLPGSWRSGGRSG